jgi:hypothetical protein
MPPFSDKVKNKRKPPKPSSKRRISEIAELLISSFADESPLSNKKRNADPVTDLNTPDLTKEETEVFVNPYAMSLFSQVKVKKH